MHVSPLRNTIKKSRRPGLYFNTQMSNHRIVPIFQTLGPKVILVTATTVTKQQSFTNY